MPVSLIDPMDTSDPDSDDEGRPNLENQAIGWGQEQSLEENLGVAVIDSGIREELNVIR
jgi:hypothetical protein